MSSTEEIKKVPNVRKYTVRCKICRKRFPTKRDQLLHKREVHPQAKTFYECTFCSKFLSTNGNLQRHLKLHQDLRPFVCKICDKAFAQAVNLDRHHSVHNGERPFQCKVCKKSFTQSNNLRRHQMTHTGEKPFLCQRCGRSFTQRGNLKKHLIGHLSGSPYTCEICQKTFHQLGYLKTHLQLHAKKGLQINVDAMVAAARDDVHQNYDLPSQPVAFEFAACHTVFANFADYELHESTCASASQN